MRTLLSKIGVTVDGVPPNDLSVSDTVSIAMELYHKAMQEPLLQQAAYGAAVFAIACSLDVNLKTAVLLFEHALVIRDLKAGGSHGGR